MDSTPANQPPEQVIEQKLVECGLNRAGLSISYSKLLQSVEIVISPAAGATVDQFQCIHDAAASEIVTFEDRELYQAYSEFSVKLARPMMLEYARKALAERGLLESFPERKNFESDDAYAMALEAHCGLEPKSAIGRTELGLILLPGGMPSVPLKGAQSERWSCLMSALIYISAKGDDFKVGMIGFVHNELPANPNVK